MKRKKKKRILYIYIYINLYKWLHVYLSLCGFINLPVVHTPFYKCKSRYVDEMRR